LVHTITPPRMSTVSFIFFFYFLFYFILFCPWLAI